MSHIVGVRTTSGTGSTKPKKKFSSVLAAPSLIISALVLVVVVAWAIWPTLFSSYDPIAQAGKVLQPPSAEHWFGTDATGRDVYSRVVHGARRTLLASLAAVSVGFIIGTTLGVFAGSTQSFVSDVIMRIVDVLLSIPSLLLSLSVIILLGFGTTNAAIAVGVTSIAVFARLSRSQVVKVRSTDYVEAAFGSGGSFMAVLWRHILPNSLTPVLALAALQFGSSILQISTLGFLGYGAPPPTPEWGLMIAESRDFVATAWWLSVLPGAVLILTVVATHRISTIIQRSES